ncbi:uncharacterized protein LOC126902976 isoform X2 [Daktulosphaira vitifoliae]|uniref:uncharacterized protein LOC126902976 isoform X2 n=1 Tax=Daktulosphaira vitifoliae TaxID=58002 RepID=UPI0021AA2756|nr:uncharacterized protein LOC126902976 isoform X2 [Daktulosphaira vitifoliae]
MIDAEKSVIHIKLMKVLGLYQLLDQKCSTLIDLFAIVRFSMTLIGGLVAGVKLYTMIRTSNKIRKCLQYTSIDYLIFKDHDRDLLMEGKKRVVFITNFYTIYWICICLCWICCPMIQKKMKTIIHFKGSVQIYNYNIFNFIFFKSDNLYNKYFKIFWMIESIFVLAWCHITIAYGVLFISICITISYQLKSISLSCSQLGYSKIKSLSSELEESSVINNFKTLIEDQIRAFMFIREIYTIFQQNTILQIGLDSSLFLSQIFLFILNISKGQSIVSFQNFLLIFSAFSNIFQMLITCYLFHTINDEKEKINFALYCCNWTEMSIEYQQLILMGMRVNEAEKTKMKITTQKLINVHLFREVFQRTYSISSVFANCVF